MENEKLQKDAEIASASFSLQMKMMESLQIMQIFATGVTIFGHFVFSSFHQAFFRMVCSAAAWRGLMMMRVMTAATPIWMRLPGMEVKGTTQLP